jgi:hypothetical protein
LLAINTKGYSIHDIGEIILILSIGDISGTIVIVISAIIKANVTKNVPLEKGINIIERKATIKEEFIIATINNIGNDFIKKLYSSIFSKITSYSLVPGVNHELFKSMLLFDAAKVIIVINIIIVESIKDDIIDAVILEV